MVDRSVAARELAESGYAHVAERLKSKDAAWSSAREIVCELAHEDSLGAGMPSLAVVGEFTIPPPGARSRDFQALHMDFGLPIAAERPSDVARFTALWVDGERAETTALTRIVPLRPLLDQRVWKSPEVVMQRLRSYAGRSSGGAGYVEGIFGRLVEAVDASPTLPSPGDPEVLCGMEFESLAHEWAHFAERGLDLDAVEERVLLRPGELLLLDNLRTAHGRLGRRQALELHQLCLGFPGLDVSQQSLLVRRVLRAFAGRAP